MTQTDALVWILFHTCAVDHTTVTTHPVWSVPWDICTYVCTSVQYMCSYILGLKCEPGYVYILSLFCARISAACTVSWDKVFWLGSTMYVCGYDIKCSRIYYNMSQSRVRESYIRIFSSMFDKKEIRKRYFKPSKLWELPLTKDISEIPLKYGSPSGWVRARMVWWMATLLGFCWHELMYHLAWSIAVNEL